MAAPRAILVVTGSRWLVQSPEATRVAQALIADRVRALPPGGAVVTGDAEGPDTWAVHLATLAVMAHAPDRVVYALDGYRYLNGRAAGRWKAPLGLAPGTARPLARNAAMIAEVARRAAEGCRVGVLALKAAWSNTDGTGQTARRAAMERLWIDPYALRRDGRIVPLGGWPFG